MHQKADEIIYKRFAVFGDYDKNKPDQRKQADHPAEINIADQGKSKKKDIQQWLLLPDLPLQPEHNDRKQNHTGQKMQIFSADNIERHQSVGTGKKD